MNLAFIGMGLMGQPMALNCLKAGHDVTVYNRTPEKCAPLKKQGATVAHTPRQAAQNREFVLICVDDTAAVETVLFSTNGIAKGLDGSKEPPPIVIDHSTISPRATQRIADTIKKECGALYLDAPVSGGTTGAQNAALSIMCGGPAEAFERAHPLLQSMGNTIVHVGRRNGDGQRTKMLNQMLVAINLLATSESLRLGEQLGLDMTEVLKAISQGAAGSWSLSNLGPRLLARDFEPGFRLRHLLKDLQYCAEIIEELPAQQAETFRATELALDLIQRAVDAGYGELNINAIAKPDLENYT